MASDLSAIIKLTTVHVELIKLLAEIAVEDYLCEIETPDEVIQMDITKESHHESH